MAKIMIAGDSPSIRFLISALVTLRGHEVVLQAKNGLEALNIYFEINPDLLIIDYQMPFMDGISLIEEITKVDPDAKVLICTGSLEMLENNSRMSKNITVLAKPFDINVFYACVASTLAN